MADDESRYIAGNDLSPRRIHLPTLRAHAPACRLLREFASGRGMTPDDPVNLSAPLWFVQALADYAQVYGPGVLYCPGVHPDILGQTLISYGYAGPGAGDLVVSKLVHEFIKSALPKSAEELKRIADNKFADELVDALIRVFGYSELASTRVENTLMDRRQYCVMRSRKNADSIVAWIALTKMIKARPVDAIYSKDMGGHYLRYALSPETSPLAEISIMVKITKHDAAPAARVEDAPPGRTPWDIF